jgi:hypothetical protein
MDSYVSLKSRKKHNDTLTFDSHVSQLCKLSFFTLRAQHHIGHYLTTGMANATVAIVQSRPYYANSLLRGIFSSNLHKLSVSRILLFASGYTSS